MNARGISLAILMSGAGAAAAAAPSGLHEIDHIPITDDLCTNVIIHANGAIAAALSDDDLLAKTVERLRGTDLDAERPARRVVVAELTRYAGAIADDAGRGRAEVKRIDAILAQTPNGEHIREAHAFSTALASVLEHQAAMARDLDGFLHDLDTAALRSADPGDPVVSAVPAELPDESFGRPRGPARSSLAESLHDPQRTPSPHDLASDLARRMAGVATDETRAAEVADAAVTGC